MRAFRSTAPIRICDNGGWTDTWFAGHGAVCNIAVSPRVQVDLVVRRRRSDAPRVVLHARNFGDSYGFDLDSRPGRHPLLEEAVDAVGVADDSSVDITVGSDVPAGSSTGTSAAVAVALVAALDAAAGRGRSVHDIATTAHRVEVERLGIQSGVQDQFAAAYGGISFIDIVEYPRAVVSPVPVTDAVVDELDRRLVLVFLGRSHVSSAVHERVINDVTAGARTALVQPLRNAAAAARDALAAGDLDAFGQAMIANTDAQAGLHPALVGVDAHVVIDAAVCAGATGWKVNGAGGDGGSVTVLLDREPAARRRFEDELAAAHPASSIIPIAVSRTGVRVQERSTRR